VEPELEPGLMRELTTRQAEILAFIRNEVRTKGRPPTLREIGEQFGIKSTNGVDAHLLSLEKRGYIHRARGTARGIVLARSEAAKPANPCCPACGQALPKEAA
jgi:repressor LexA